MSSRLLHLHVGYQYAGSKGSIYGGLRRTPTKMLPNAVLLVGILNCQTIDQKTFTQYMI